MKKIILNLIAFCFFCILGAGCSPKVPEHYVAFFLESPQRAGTFEMQRSFVLPVIDKEVKVGNDPVFNIDAFSDCVVSEHFDPVMEQNFDGLFFRIKDEYAIRLKQVASNGAGRKFVLVADGKPLGFCTLKKDFSRSDLFFHIMTSATGQEKRRQLEDLSFELNSFILEFREYKEKR